MYTAFVAKYLQILSFPTIIDDSDYMTPKKTKNNLLYQKKVVYVHRLKKKIYNTTSQPQKIFPWNHKRITYKIGLAYQKIGFMNFIGLNSLVFKTTRMKKLTLDQGV